MLLAFFHKDLSLVPETRLEGARDSAGLIYAFDVETPCLRRDSR